MVDQTIEIPLPGRILSLCGEGTVSGASAVSLPAFVAGPENVLVATTFHQLLAETAVVAENARSDPKLSVRPSVLALFGPPGTGKTHLSRGLVQHWQHCRGDHAAEYFAAADFRRGFIAAMNGAAITDFRRRLRSLELLAIDDLQHLPDDTHLLRELRYTLDALVDAGGLVVVTSHRPVCTLPNLTNDLRSRLAAGLMLQLAEPGTASRMRIVQQMTAALGRRLSDDAIQRLVLGLHGTARQLIGAIFDLFTARPESQTADPVGSGHVAFACIAREPTLPEIVAAVAKYYGLPQKQLKSGSRKQSAVYARATAVYLARELTHSSYDEIGRALGGRDHTTIMHNYKKIERDRHADLATQQAIDDLQRILLYH